MRQDNEQAFSCLIDRYDSVLFRHLLRRIQSAADAQEILQDIFISLWNKRALVYAQETIYPYLFRAARYEIIDWYTKSKKKILHQELLLAEEYLIDFPAEDFLIAAELNDLLNAEVAKMPATMKSVFELSRNESLSVKEIAASLSLSEQTVKNNITLALKRLRLTLKQEHYVVISAIILSKLH